MKTSLKTLFAAIAILGAASMTAHAQAYKPDWATKLILPKDGTTPGASTNITIQAGSTSTGYTLTLPTAAPGGNGYLLSGTTDGALSWVDAAASVTLAGDVTGAANSNSVVKLRGVSLNSDMATPSDANMMIYNSTGTSWHTVAMSGDVTIDHSGVSAIGSGKVTSTMIADGTIANADIASNAAIDYGKLNLTGSIVNADVSETAGIAYSKLNLGNSIVNGDIVDGTIDNAKLASSSVTVTGGTGLSGGGAVALGGSTSLTLDLTHANTWTGTQTLGGVALTKASVSTSNATEDDYALSTSNSYFYLASTATSGTTVSSIAGGVDGRVIVIVNNGAKNITLLSDDGSTGTDVNRFKFAGGENVILAPDGIATLVYDGTSTNHRWRLVSAQ